MTQTTPSHSQAVELARRFHDAYERLAPQFGYITREDTRAFDPESSNGKLMTAVCAELTSQQEVAAPVSDAEPRLDWAIRTLRALADGGRGKLGDAYPEIVSVIGGLKSLVTSRVPVASLANREQGVEAVGAVPGKQDQSNLAVAESDPVQGPLAQAVLALNTAWNRREPDDAIAGHMDLCRRLALASQPKAPAPVPVVQGEAVFEIGLGWLKPPDQFPRGTLLYATPFGGAGGEVGAMPDLFTQGVNAAAAMLDKMADDFANEHSSQDPDTGVYEFGRGGKEDHYNTLRELADDIRSIVLGNLAPEQATTGSGQGVTDAEREELHRLRALINTPHTADWVKSIELEAAHQQERWGAAHDDGKTAQDWFWLLGWLAGKAVAAFGKGDREKGLHHIVSSGAVLLNWHRNVTGQNTGMRPGITDPDSAILSTASPAGEVKT